ncbi:hypothetical protein HYV73_01320 [Candidatus Uhrbacteria bacterium]|nr:hypothetical protein [Candidatus Uhrbacteria bacterium]
MIRRSTSRKWKRERGLRSVVEIGEKGRELVRFLRDEEGVIQPVESYKLDLDDPRIHNGVILVGCPDCDQRRDIFEQKEKMLVELGLDPRIHPLLLNGGGLLIPKKRDGSPSPFNVKLPQDEVLLENIRKARKIKKIELVGVLVHYPCGAGEDVQLPEEDVIDMLPAAKARIQRECPGIKVACFLHVDKGLSADGKPQKRTYFVSSRRWLAWAKKRGVEHKWGITEEEVQAMEKEKRPSMEFPDVTRPFVRVPTTPLDVPSEPVVPNNGVSLVNLQVGCP